MPKKAMLVEFSIATRVVIDIPEGTNLDSDEVFAKAGRAAVENIRKNTFEDIHYPYMDNIVELNEDEEVPFGELDEDNLIK